MTASNPAGSTVSEALAGWASALTWKSLPAEVVAMARRVLLDTLGCALQGSTTPEARHLARARADLGAAGPCSVWGTKGGAPPQAAALFNGAHAHMRELDDIGGGGHAGACQVPAVLAAAELSAGDGRDVLLGLVAGHEITSRLTDAASYDVMTLRGWHTTGVYGSIGAGVAASRVLCLDAERTAHALGLAGSYTGGTWAFMADCAMSKRLHPGRSAEIGLTAAVLARRGVTGPREVLDAPWGGLFSTFAPGESNPVAPLTGLGQGYRILRKGFKPYPVCWGINSAADAMLELRAKHEIGAEEIKHVRVVLSEMSRRMIGGVHLDSVLEAQMSVTYALACIIRFGRLTLREFTPAAVGDKVTRALMQRITLVVDPEAHGERQTLVVETRDGRRLTCRIEVPLGHWDNPQSDDALREKFLRLAGAALGAARAAKVADLVGRIDKPGALTRLFALLRPA